MAAIRRLPKHWHPHSRKAKAAGITKIAFDRGPYRYHVVSRCWRMQHASRTRILTGAMYVERFKTGGLEDKVIKIRRCASVVNGGRRFQLNALVVVGDRRGQVGYGYGKANEVPPAVEKAVKDSSRSLKKVILKGETIPHRSSSVLVQRAW